MLGTVRKVGFAASMLSVVGSLYIYFIESNHELGIFVGLWAHQSFSVPLKSKRCLKIEGLDLLTPS